jgi:hypothetical protein
MIKKMPLTETISHFLRRGNNVHDQNHQWSSTLRSSEDLNPPNHMKHLSAGVFHMPESI